MKNWNECSLAQHRFSIRFVTFFVSSVCLLMRVTMVDKNKAVVCRLVATLAIKLFEKKIGRVKCRVRSGIWKGIYHAMLICWMIYKKRMCIEIIPSWCRQINWGNWDSLSELHSSVCEIRLKVTVLRHTLLPIKTAQFTQFFRQVWRHTVKSLSLTKSASAL